MRLACSAYGIFNNAINANGAAEKYQTPISVNDGGYRRRDGSTEKVSRYRTAEQIIRYARVNL